MIETKPSFSIEKTLGSTAGSSVQSPIITNKPDQSSKKTIGYFQAIFLISRSIVGVGVLAQPHLNEEFGVLCIAICYPITAALIIYCISLLPKIADDMKYEGSSLEEFTELTLGPFHRKVATFFNLLFTLAVSTVAVIFSINFVNYAICQLGGSYCNN